MAKVRFTGVHLGVGGAVDDQLRAEGVHPVEQAVAVVDIGLLFGWLTRDRQRITIRWRLDKPST
jgi:hypothetical protein